MPPNNNVTDQVTWAINMIQAQLALSQQAVANLNAVAATASTAINNSSQDRAALHVQLDALAATVAALPTSSLTVIASAYKATPLLALGATDIVLTLTRTMPNTSYNVEILPGQALIGTTVTAAVKTKTTSSVTVTLTATLAISVASSLQLIAWI